MSLKNFVAVGIVVLLCFNMVTVSNGLPFLQWPLGNFYKNIDTLAYIVVVKTISLKRIILIFHLAESRTLQQHASTTTVKPRNNNLLHRKYLSAKRRNDILDRLTS